MDSKNSKSVTNKKGSKTINSNQLNKLGRIRNARSIRTQIIGASNNKPDNKNKSAKDYQGNKRNQEPSIYSNDGGLLKLPEFISSRNFEIKQLAYSMKKSSQSSSTRCFQSLPRKLRRRTASHNIKRIPKRLRNRALREMLKGDQHITKGEKLTKPKIHFNKKNFYKLKMSIKILRLITKSKFMKNALPLKYYQTNLPKKYQLRKVLRVLQTHVKNSKNPEETKVLNNALGHVDVTGLNKLVEDPLELSLLVKSHKYAKRQANHVWLPTHIWNAKRSHMMNYYNKKVCYTPTQKCYKQTHRIGNPNSVKSDGCLIEDTSYMGKCVIESLDPKKSLVSLFNLKKTELIIKNNCIYLENGSTKLGCIEKLVWLEKPNKMLLVLHPSIYSNFFQKFLTVFAKEINELKTIKIQDCQYSIGSINLMGSNSLLNLLKIFRSFPNEKSNLLKNGIESTDDFETFMKLSLNLRDFELLDKDFSLSMNVYDPRLLKAPRLPSHTNKYLYSKHFDINDLLIELHNQKSSNSMFVNKKCDILNDLCDSEKRYNSYENKLTLKALSKRYRAASGKNFVGSVEKDTPIPVHLYKNSWNGFTVLLPYHWLLPVWYQLNKIPRTYHVGLKQIQQLKYEKNALNFPNDHVDTQVGYKNLLLNGQVSKEFWLKKPASKKINFSKLKNVHYNDDLVRIGEVGDPFKSDYYFLKFLTFGVEYILQRADNEYKEKSEIPLVQQGSTIDLNSTNLMDAKTIHDLIVHYKGLSTELTNATQFSPVSTDISRSSSLSGLYDISKFWSEFHQWKVHCKPVSITMMNKGHPTDNARLYAITKDNWETYWKHLSDNENLETLKNNLSIKKVYLPKVQDLIGFVNAGTYNLSIGKGTGVGYITTGYNNIGTHNSNKDKDASLYCENIGLLRNVGTNDYKIVRFKDI